MAVMPTTLFATEDRWDVPDVLLVPMDSLDAYFARIHAVPTLSAAEESTLGQKVQAGDRDAALRLAVHNLRYAAHLARKWEGRGSDEPVWSLGDAVQAANVGLWTAARRFNPAIARFTTYATHWIRQAWDRARNDFLWQVRLPAHAAAEWRAYQRAVAAWTASRSQEPTPQDLAHLLGWPPERIAFWQQWAETGNHPASLDTPVGAGDTALGDLVAAPDDATNLWRRLDHYARKQAVDQLLEHLNPREADVLRLRFGLAGAPMTLQEISEILHVTRERVRQIEAKALKTLRAWADRHPEGGWRDLIGD